MYVREKGNSTLALIEETGIIGLVLFYIPIFIFLKKSLPSSESCISVKIYPVIFIIYLFFPY